MDEVFTGTQRRGVEEDVTAAQPSDRSSGGGRRLAYKENELVEMAALLTL